MANKIYQLYLELLKKHGPPEKLWPQWCAEKKSSKDREKIAIGAILTQRTSWHNAHLALINLKKAKLLSLRKIFQLTNLKELSDLIKQAGFYQSKPRRLLEFCNFIIKSFGTLENLMKKDQNFLRQKLLSCYGIGPETVDTILLYALEKPVFVVDEYTRRLVRERKLANNFDYDFLKNLFERNLPKDVKIYQDFHALIIFEQKRGQDIEMKKY